MPDIPEAAAQAAAEAIGKEYESLREWDREAFARAALEAAAPAFAVREEEIRADERRKLREQVRGLTEWRPDGGFVNLFAFVARHKRLSNMSASALSIAFTALAEEIAGVLPERNADV